MSYIPSEMSFEALKDLFESIGAPDAADWAHSEAKEDIPQIARYLFLRGCWQATVNPRDDSWIDRVVEGSRREPDAPYSGGGLALERMLALGVERHDIIELVRSMQGEVIAGITYLLDDPDAVIRTLPERGQAMLDGFGWTLIEVDADGIRGRRINGLHESVLETEPLGNEMRPMPRPDRG